MAHTRQRIDVVRGSTKTLRITVTDQNGDRRNLTTDAITFSVKQSLADVAATLQYTIGTGITLLDQDAEATKGQADIVIPYSASAALEGKYYYDCWLVAAGGQRYAILPPGKIYFEKSVSELA